MCDILLRVAVTEIPDEDEPVGNEGQGHRVLDALLAATSLGLRSGTILLGPASRETTPPPALRILGPIACLALKKAT
jgi:hypothetical protein